MRKIFTILAVMFALTCVAQARMQKAENMADSIRYYQQKISKFPSDAPATEEYLDAVMSLCVACYKADSVVLGEQMAATALVRGSALADSCWQAATLFSTLAYFYEQRGDTIMPQHFHNKSQVLMMRYAILKEHADSVEYYNQRIEQVLNMRHQQKHLFSRKNRKYAYLNDEFCATVSSSCNTMETIYLGEQQLKLVRDSAFLADDNVCSETYFRLIYSHALMGHLDRAMTLLEEAKEYYRRFPREGISESFLWWQVGEGLFNYGDYAQALSCLQNAKKLSTDVDKPWIDELKKTIKQCRKLL